MRGRAASLSAACLVWSALARGAPAGATESSSPTEAAVSEPPTVGYGWQVLAIDAAALALGGTALGIALSDAPKNKSSAKVLGLAGLGIYLAGPPILHGVRGNGDNAERSLGYRLGLPLAGAAAGFVGGFAVAAVASSGHEHSGEGLDLAAVVYPVVLAMVGSGVGAMAAMVVDAAVVAREPVTRTTAWGVVPSFDPRSRSIGLTAVGRFF